MRIYHLLLLAGFILLLYCSCSVQAWSGPNICSKRVVEYVTERYCVYRWWRSCCLWRYRSICRYKIERYCCPGWKHGGNQRCDIPICTPGCFNQGTCVAPRKCDCPVGYTGDLCGVELCSYERPCYPGNCKQGTADCTCAKGYSNADRCITLEAGQEPDLTTSSAVLYVVDPKTSMVFFSIITDATFVDGNQNQLFWTNLQFFNKLNITWESFHIERTDLPPRPPYIHDAKFGIVEATTTILHLKRDKNTWLTAIDETMLCKENGISQNNPESELLRCVVDAGRFVTSLEHEDMLKLKVRSKNGGFRVVVYPNTTTHRQYFKGRWKEKEMEFRFDFQEPCHCKINTTKCPSTGLCNDLPVRIDGPELRKTGFTIRWPGWTDLLSNIERYIWRIFRLEANRDKKLVEVGKPVYWQQANGTNAGSETDIYTPETAGMYSVYLQVSDRANNSRFARTLVLYDPTSGVEINPSPDAKLFVSSASANTDFQWQTNLTNQIVVSWKNHFRNQFHENNSLLNSVLEFPAVDFIQTVGNRDIIDSKKVLPEFDDNEGERTIKAIKNIHGMVRFEAAYEKVSDLGSSCRTAPSQWKNVTDPFNEEHEFSVQTQDASSVCIWIRGFDVLGNNQTDMTVVHFDSTAPSLGEFQFEKNKAPEGMAFHSSIQCRTRDVDSGVKELRWRLFNSVTGAEFDRGVFDTRLKQGESCSSLDSACECTHANILNCYHLNNQFYFPHCGVNVTKREITSLRLTLELEAVNSAGLTSNVTMYYIENPADLNGITEYVAPMNYRSSETGTTSVTIEWDNPPGCYSFTAIQVAYRPVSGGKVTNYTVAERNTKVFLNELSRGTDYVMWIYNIYETEVSNPSEFKFTTISFLGSEIAGLVIGLILLLIVIILLVIAFVLWRRGQLRSTIERRFTRLTRVGTRLRNRVRRSSQAIRTTIFNNLQQDDDLYVYGNMSFDSKQNWNLSGSDLDLQDIIAEGRFARVYRAVLMVAGSSPKTVAAKMLLPTKIQMENERLLMNAKINFMATNGLDHENVVKFAGAIVDDEERGPIMLLEYCEMGTLKSWLIAQKQQGRVSEDVVDRMFHIVFGVCKGMDYLASKDIVHRKLAARNILLDFTLQPKIIGFGPVPDELSDDSDNTTKGERLPLKWMAPELVKARSTKNSTEKTDVWSYAVVVWETFSLGAAPFSNIKGGDLLKKLNQGYRMPRPEFMTDEYDAMTKRCWNHEPEDRPNFATLVKEQSLLFDNSGNRSSYYDSNGLKNYY